MSEIIQIKFTGTKLDFIKFQVRHSIPTHLSEGEIELIAYLFLYKELAVRKMLEDGCSKSEKSLNNYLSSLRKKGVVIGKSLVSGLYLSETPDRHYFTFSLSDVGVEPNAQTTKTES